MGAQTYAAFFEHELLKLIDVEIEAVKHNMSLGHISTYDEYKYACGKIAGLRAVIELMAEAEKICNER